MDVLQVGSLAPDFTLPSSTGAQFQLSQLKGKKVILYFYPKDNTSGCTQQACDFRDSLDQFSGKNTVIVGVSKDSIKSHTNFIDKYQLPFVLLSDEDARVQELFGVWQQKSMYGKSYMGTERSTFVIDESGIIREIHRKVKVKGHIESLLKSL